MTEKEIINYLKENRTKGVAYLFLPEEVWDWIEENYNDPKLMYLKPNGRWGKFSETDFDNYDNVVFALPEYYEVKQEKNKSGWVEFTITDGVFTSKIECDEGESYTEDFHWWDWQGFLTKSFDYDMNFTAFGGWQYGNNKAWNMCQQMLIDGEYASILWYRSEPSECKPAIPTKIRFWREAK